MRRIIPWVLLTGVTLCTCFVARADVPTARYYYVGTTQDKNTGEGPLSLREAVMMASAVGGDSVIVLPRGTYPFAISSTQVSRYPGITAYGDSRYEHQDSAIGDLDVTAGSVTIIGAGPRSTVLQWDDSLSIHEHNSFFYVGPGARLALYGITLQGAYFGLQGGAVLNDGALLLSRCIVAHNRSYLSGGGIESNGSLTAVDTLFQGNTSEEGGGGGGGAVLARGPTAFSNCTFADNDAGTFGDGGGLLVDAGSTCELVNCTFTGNTSDWFGTADGLACLLGGAMALRTCTIVRNVGTGLGLHSTGSTTLVNTIVADNATGSTVLFDGAQLEGSFLSLGHNLLGNAERGSWMLPSDRTGIDAGIAPLADNGGPVPTCAVLPGSPAIDGALPQAAPPTDARGVPAAGAAPDLGAYEFSPGPVLTVNDAVPTLPGAARPIDPAADMSLPDDVTWFGGNVAVRLAPEAPGAVGLDAPNALGITRQGDSVSFRGAPFGTLRGDDRGLSVSLDGNVTPGAVRALLRSFTFQAGSDAENRPAMVRWSIIDGLGRPSPPAATRVLIFRVPEPAPEELSGVDGAYALPWGTPFQVPAPGVLQGAAGNGTGPLRAVLISPPEQAAEFHLDGDGSFRFRPWVRAPGGDSFTWRVTDGRTLSNLVTVRFNIAGAPPAATPHSRVSGTVRFEDFRSRLQLAVHATTDVNGRSRGTFTLFDHTGRRVVVGTSVESVVVTGRRARLYGTAHWYTPRHRPQRAVIDVDLNADTGAPEAVRMEITDRLWGPGSITSGSITIR